MDNSQQHAKPMTLPIHAVLPRLLAALRDYTGAVLVAPPGAGKTTAVAPALLGEVWCDGTIILTSPRRVAARAAAERMAAMLSEPVGRTVGYATRFDSRRSDATRILVVTEAILVNRLLDDPDLDGISALLFDEVHERHLDGDLGLALALETRAVLRPNLRVLAMSATIDGTRFAGLLGDGAAVIESAGKAHPLRIEWRPQPPDRPIEAAMVSAIRDALDEAVGDMLAFLPGLREIERVRQRLEPLAPDVAVLPLHGQIDRASQRRALTLHPDGRRRVVLASAIAESSLTLDGVRIVVDSGLARRAVFDRAAGVTRLETVAASQASADQRAGRAARQGPGLAIRLWSEAAHGGRRAFSPPEILEADLAPLLLSLARRGTRDPDDLAWLDPPPPAAIGAAKDTLRRLGALDAEERITPLGKQIAALPLDPVGAAALLHGAQAGNASEVARTLLLLQERGLGGAGEDLAARRERFAREGSARAKAARKLADSWARRAEKLVGKRHDRSLVPNPAIAMARAMPDRLARSRSAEGTRWTSAGGRGFVLDPTSPLARAEWLLVCDAQGAASGARIMAALALSDEAVRSELADLIETRSTVRWNEEAGRVEARLERRLGTLVLSSGPDPAPDREAVRRCLAEVALERLETLLPAALLARARFIGVNALSPDALRERAEEWLMPLLGDRTDLDLPPSAFAEATLGLLNWEDRQRLDREAPREFVSPAGTRHPIAYDGPDAPSVEVRAQALFGLDAQPMIGKTSLLLHLTSPADRPIAATRDLPGFWRGGWCDALRDMKGRYPKHRWPDEPWNAEPGLATSKAFAAGRR